MTDTDTPSIGHNRPAETPFDQVASRKKHEGPKPRPVRDRFEAKFTRGDPGQCWLWRASFNTSGYGHIGVGRYADGDRRLALAHRLSWELYRGPIPDGAHVLHRCDVRACVNPAHLFLGTNADNMADRDKKGRHRSLLGEAHGRCKLTDAEVAEIRSLFGTMPQSKIATRFGVSESQISNIIRGKQRNGRV